ncbi:hypothetical protein Agub_g3953, partial [Astrephomene gubernaculifera]
SSLTTAVQFADDTEVVLRGPDAVGDFLQHMETFAKASGQRLNLDKVELLPIGVQTGTEGQQVIHGVSVARTAVALNVPFTNSDTVPGLDWSKRFQEAEHRLQKLARLPLSIFGRATGAAAYALHTVTWHMEHSGLPPGDQLDNLGRLVAKFIDRHQGPQDRERRATGVPGRLLAGHPRAGGFGALPLIEHIRARFACWGARLVCSAVMPRDSLHPWQRALLLYLRRLHPAFGPLSLLTASRRGPWLGVDGLPEDIRRVVTSMAILPPVTDIGSEPLVPGSWCWGVPLWGNPFLPVGLPGQPGVLGLEHHYPVLVHCHALSSLGMCVAALAQLRCFEDTWDSALLNGVSGVAEGRVMERCWSALVRRFLDPASPDACALCSLPRCRDLLTSLESLLGAVPVAWVEAAEAFLVDALPPQPLPASEVDAWQVLVPRLGWQLPHVGAVPLRNLSVRMATVLQLGGVFEERAVLHAAFIREALGLPATQQLPEGVLDGLRDSFQRLWSIRWENGFKEAFWRLSIDGVPLLGNSHMSRARPECCGCGSVVLGVSPRLHFFWACPVARAVVEQLEVTLGIAVPRAALWLALPPSGVQQCVWDVVVLAALSAMEEGRRLLRARVRESGSAGVVPGLAAVVALSAVSWFWGQLRGFACLGVPRRGWAGVGPSHPFLRIVGGRFSVGR